MIPVDGDVFHCSKVLWLGAVDREFLGMDGVLWYAAYRDSRFRPKLRHPSPSPPKMSKYGYTVLLKGLPFSVKEEDIKAFFKSITLPSSSIHIVRYPDGKGCGIGFVELQSKEELDLALLMDRNHIGARYVEVSVASLAELQLIKRSAAAGHTPNELYKLASEKPARVGGGGRANGRERSPVRTPKSRFVYIQGIPSDHNYKEVRKFFSGCVIGKNCVSLVRGPNGVFRGDGFVEFLTIEDAQKAVERDGSLMNGHPIKVRHSSEEDALRILGGSWSPTYSPPSRRRREEDHRDPYGEEGRSVGQGRWEGRMVPAADRNDGYVSSRPYPLLESPPRPPLPLFPPNEPIQPLLSLSEDYSYARPRPPEPYQRITESRDGYRTPSFIAQRQVQACQAHPSNRPHPRGDVGVDLQSRGRREVPVVVRLEGLPYSATITDVINFFHGFDVEYDHVRIQCREDGSPSGKAFVTMRSDWLAKSAIRELDRQYIMGRYIEMYLV